MCPIMDVFILPGEVNVHHYFVATQDPELEAKLRAVPGMELVEVVHC